MVPNIDFGITSQDSSTLEGHWEELLRFHRDFYIPEDLNAEELSQFPLLDDEWLTPDHNGTSIDDC